MKGLAATAAGAAALLLLGWAAGVAHAGWIARRAVDRLREEHLLGKSPPAGVPSAREVADLGCRALPALIDELDPDHSSYYLCRVGERITMASDGAAPRVLFGDDPAQRRESIDALRAWWAREGGRHHQWWRFWSSRCPPLVD